MASILHGSDDNRSKVTGRDDVGTTVDDDDDIDPVWLRGSRSAPTALSSMAVGILATALAVVGVAMMVVAFGYSLDWLPRFAVAALGAWALASAIVLVISASDEVGGPHDPTVPSAI